VQWGCRLRDPWMTVEILARLKDTLSPPSHPCVSTVHLSIAEAQS
jgi:hypothetical protein